MASTYTPIATTTLGSAQTTVTFSSIAGSYTDLICVINAKASVADNCAYRLNSDTGSNYSYTNVSGNGSAASSGRGTSQTYGRIDGQGYVDASNFDYVNTVSFMNYANTTAYKTSLARSNNATTGTDAQVTLWRSTSAITSITFLLTGGNNFVSGSTFTLYGIKAA